MPRELYLRLQKILISTPRVRQRGYPFHRIGTSRARRTFGRMFPRTRLVLCAKTYRSYFCLGADSSSQWKSTKHRLQFYRHVLMDEVRPRPESALWILSIYPHALCATATKHNMPATMNKRKKIQISTFLYVICEPYIYMYIFFTKKAKYKCNSNFSFDLPKTFTPTSKISSNAEFHFKRDISYQGTKYQPWRIFIQEEWNGYILLTVNMHIYILIAEK